MTTIVIRGEPAQRQQPPVEAVEMLEATWTRCRMAGIQLAHNDRVVRRFGWTVTGLATLTSTSIFATLQQSPSAWARSIVGGLVALAAVLGVWQTKATKTAQDDAKVLFDVLRTFHGLHERLLSAISEFQTQGTPIAAQLMSEAKAERDRHTLDMGAEAPSYDAAARSVVAEMHDLGLLSG